VLGTVRLGSFGRAFLVLPRDIVIDRSKPFPQIHSAQPPWSAQKETLPPAGPPDKFRGNKVILAGAVVTLLPALIPTSGLAATMEKASPSARRHWRWVLTLLLLTWNAAADGDKAEDGRNPALPKFSVSEEEYQKNAWEGLIACSIARHLVATTFDGDGKGRAFAPPRQRSCIKTPS